MKNQNKGQTLVTFILLLPFLLIVFGFIIDYGVLSIEKRRMDNLVKENIEYGLKSIDLEESLLKQNITVILQENIKEIRQLQITISDHSIDILLEKQYPSLYSVMMGQKIYKIKSHYRGYIDDEKITLVKE